MIEWSDVQRHLGIVADNVAGPATLKAIAAALGIGGGKMHMSERGLDLIRNSEGLRLTAYPDPASGGEPWTIGYGHTGGVSDGMAITQDEANDLLRSDVAKFEDGVAALAPNTTQNQFDALVDFAYNLGLGNLASSTLLKKHNAGDYAGAKNEFGKWVKAAGKTMPGLVKRRAAEAELYAS